MLSRPPDIVEYNPLDWLLSLPSCIFEKSPITLLTSPDIAE